jgi:hypothetical protein
MTTASATLDADTIEAAIDAKLEALGVKHEDTYLRKLPCELTQEEVDRKLHEAREHVDFIARREAEIELLKLEIKAKKEDIESTTREVVELVRAADDRQESREVVCYEQFDLPSNTVFLHRLDTSALVEQRAMTADEREELSQLTLDQATLEPAEANS